ncbi:hypothetical protein LJC60_03980 [Ruminococcaceae bacterium OttesenSCG-928-D13]|nr:hypothetical protein [Ruminococcaceae bacterium OttesenSCG-928-D13]
MDIAYHYYAVKTLAGAAGFNEDEAQIIASFSQYVDDFNLYAFRAYSNVPDYVKGSPYDLHIPSPLKPYNFNPATTGFRDFVDMAMLVTDWSQKFTSSPFHFIPRDNARISAKDFRTVPAQCDDGSLIAGMLSKAKSSFLQCIPNRKHALMHIGMLLHTYSTCQQNQP